MALKSCPEFCPTSRIPSSGCAKSTLCHPSGDESWSSPVPSCHLGEAAPQSPQLNSTRCWTEPEIPSLLPTALAVLQQLLCEPGDGKCRSCAFPSLLDGNQSGFSRGWKVQGLLLGSFSAAALCSATPFRNLEGISPRH